jgi:hypothetical protein
MRKRYAAVFALERLSCETIHYLVHRGTSGMQGEQRHYISYLLRLWQTKSEGELVWRVSLENPHTHERQGFASLEELCGFLAQEIGCVAQDKVSPPDSAKGTDRGSQTKQEPLKNNHE